MNITQDLLIIDPSDFQLNSKWACTHLTPSTPTVMSLLKILSISHSLTTLPKWTFIVVHNIMGHYKIIHQMVTEICKLSGSVPKPWFNGHLKDSNTDSRSKPRRINRRSRLVTLRKMLWPSRKDRRGFKSSIARIALNLQAKVNLPFMLKRIGQDCQTHKIVRSITKISNKRRVWETETSSSATSPEKVQGRILSN